MGTGKPLVSVLLAVYKPNEKWLREQLKSLNEQTYPNIEILICDDCPESPVEVKIFEECLTEFPFTVYRNDRNLGSNKAFERLTELGNGKYFSYCDQDDVWHSDKVERMVQVLENTGSPLVCCDLAIIDGSGEKIADSITKIRKRHVYYEGEGLAKRLLVKNFVTGCAMMIHSEIAKSAVQFINSVVHDQWLAINAALKGRIEVIREPLIDYRQHENNQTGVLEGVTAKNDYYKSRIENMRLRIGEYKVRLAQNKELEQTISELEKLNNARSRYFYSHKLKDLNIMKKYKNYAKQSVTIESVMPFIPDFIIKHVFKLIKSGKI